MNKKILFLLIFLFLFTGVVHAEKCTIISGTGSNIGDEIACGDEHFYVIDNDGTDIKMLAKYNLYVGEDIYLEVTTSLNECSSLVTSKNGYTISNSLVSSNVVECLYSISTTSTEIKQETYAIGAHGTVSGEPEYPEMGITRFHVLYTNFINLGTNYADGFADGELNPDSSYSSNVISYLNDYKSLLNNTGVDIKNIDLITVSEINDLVKKITNEELPLSEWYAKDWESTYLGGDSYVYKVGSIKDQLPQGYEWIYSTTYWTRTVTPDSSHYVYFVDTLGDLCSAFECIKAVGAGIRPVVTISAEDIDYKIETKTDGNGTVVSEKIRAYGGEVIKFTITPNKGYVLSMIKVTDANGNVVTFTDYTFTMPNADVLIEATFVPDNPKTGKFISYIVLVLLMLIGTLLYIISQKRLFNRIK